MSVLAAKVPRSACWSAFMVVLGAVSLEAQPYGLPGPRPHAGPYLSMPATPPQPAGAYTTALAFPNLTFANPTFLAQAPRSNRLYVSEREGQLYSFQNDPGTSGRTLVLDLTSRTQGWDDCGFMSFAFHPDFGLGTSSRRGYFYVYYEHNPTPVPGPNRPPTETPTFNRLSRFTIPDGQFTADAASELILVNQHDRNVWHGGGSMLFHPVDGFLYFTIGDEGNANDSYDVTQRLTDKLFGGVFRIDVDMRGGAISHAIRRQPQSYAGRPSSTANYFIPNDNPFLDPAGGLLEEFYALGVRSPHRITHDAIRNQIILGDVGQGLVEEVDIIEKGRNYQWPYKEGTANGPRAKPGTLIGTDAPPLYEYFHGGGTFEGNCIIGGYIYRGAAHAADLGGKYIFGDNTFGRLWAMDLGTSPPAVTYLTNMPSGSNYTGLSSFGVDAAGELYLLKMNHTSPGAIYKLAREGTAGTPFPPLLSQTGAFTNVATLAPSAALIPYAVGSELWSDGGHKTRWLAVPYDGGAPAAGEIISFAPTGEWAFPQGTVFVKHFELTVNETSGARRRLETRLLVRQSGGGVYGVTYKWRPDGSNADLLLTGLDEQINITGPGGSRTQTWHYPSSVECLTCHNAAAQHVLGVKTRQLNNDVVYPGGVSDNQLRSLNHLALFSPAISEAAIPGYSSLAAIDDPSASLEHRVRSYLDANCALCHRPGNVQAFFDARFDTPLQDQGLVNGPVASTLGIDGAAVFKPQDIWRSVAHVRASSTVQGTRMPPLARNVPHAEALEVMKDWVNSLPGTPALAPPAISPVGGTFEDSLQVTITHPGPAATIRYTQDGTDPTASSPAYAGPLTLTDSAIVTARAFRAGFVTSVRARAEFQSAFAGLLGQYFDEMNFTNLRVTRVDPTVDFDWGLGSPDPAVGPNQFSVRWTGQVDVLHTEAYTFYTVSDDGVRLWVGGLPIIDNWTDHGPTEDSGTVTLEAGGAYDLAMEMYENGGGAVARLLWSSFHTPKQAIPASRLFSGSRPSELDINNLACVRQIDEARLSWTNRGAYEEIRVYQNGEFALALPPGATSTSVPFTGDRIIERFRVASVVNGEERGGQTCFVQAATGTYATVINEDFSPPPVTPPIDLNCSAALRNSRLELTEPIGSQAGSAFFTAPHPDDEFLAEFDFSFPEPSALGADGLAFIVNTGGPIDICGASGGAMGFRASDAGTSVFPGFAIVFDTWQNPGEPSHNWVGFVDLRQGGAAQAGADVPEEFCGNGVFHATITGSQGAFVVALENASIGMARRTVLAAGVDDFQPADAHFGFAAGTGGAWARHTVDNFRLGLLTDPPVAGFTASPLSGEAPLLVRFTNTSTGPVTSYLWSFGDLASSTASNPTHIYLAAGTYTVRLAATGPGGADVLTRTNYINVQAPQGSFIRGDSNGNAVVDLSDAVYLLLHSFNGTVNSNCLDAMDADDNGRIEVTDALRILAFLFRGGIPPAAPFPAAGKDGTPDPLPVCQRGL